MIVTKQELLDKVTGLLGGRVAEELFIGEIGTGAYSDFQQATRIVRAMIMEYGMSDKLGPLQFGATQGQVFLGRDIGHEQNYSDSIAYEIDQEMQNLIRSSYERCRELLTKHSKEMHLIANTLLEKETLELDQIAELIEQGYLSEDGKPEEGDAITNEAGEPIIDSIGDVRVRIQGKNDDESPLDLSKDIPNKPDPEEGNGPDDGNKGGGSLV